MTRIRILFVALSIPALATPALAEYNSLGGPLPEPYRLVPERCQRFLALNAKLDDIDDLALTRIKIGCNQRGDAQFAFIRAELADNQTLKAVVDGASREVICREVLGITDDFDSDDIHLVNEVCVLAQDRHPNPLTLSLARSHVMDVLRQNHNARTALNQVERANDGDSDGPLVTRAKHEDAVGWYRIAVYWLSMLCAFLVYAWRRSNRVKNKRITELMSSSSAVQTAN